jgi:hypothetical protein
MKMPPNPINGVTHNVWWPVPGANERIRQCWVAGHLVDLSPSLERIRPEAESMAY